MTIKDLLGNELYVGDRVANAVTIGRCAGLVIGTITKIIENDNSQVVIYVQNEHRTFDDGSSSFTKIGKIIPYYSSDKMVKL